MCARPKASAKFRKSAGWSRATGWKWAPTAPVDRAALSSTVLDDGTCLDNLVQVGHNVRLGKDCLIVSQVGISGSTHVGDNVTMAGQAGVARTPCASATGSPSAPSPASPRTSPTGRPWGGRPAVDYTTFMRTLALMPRFPELFKRLSKLEKELEALRADDIQRPAAE